jgi:hypothetical protein
MEACLVGLGTAAVIERVSRKTEIGDEVRSLQSCKDFDFCSGLNHGLGAMGGFQKRGDRI